LDLGTSPAPSILLLCSARWLFPFPSVHDDREKIRTCSPGCDGRRKEEGVDSLGLKVGLKSPPKKLQMFQLMSTPLVVGDSNGTLGERLRNTFNGHPSSLRPPHASLPSPSHHRLLHFSVMEGLSPFAQSCPDCSG
ncbi:hypothetical protein CSPX01_12072, partial [Colletotrichum filicis]